MRKSKIHKNDILYITEYRTRENGWLGGKRARVKEICKNGCQVKVMDWIGEKSIVFITFENLISKKDKLKEMKRGKKR